MDGRLIIDNYFPDKEYEEYIKSIIKPYRTKYEKFAVIGDIIICSDFFNNFFLEIKYIVNNKNYNFGFRIETKNKDFFIVVDPPIMNELINIYHNIHNVYMTNKIYNSTNLIEDNERFSEINSQPSNMKSNLFKIDNLSTSMNGSYIKLNKSDIVSLNVYQSIEMKNMGHILYEYIITKNKTKLFYHFITLNLII